MSKDASVEAVVELVSRQKALEGENAAIALANRRLETALTEALEAGERAVAAEQERTRQVGAELAAEKRERHREQRESAAGAAKLQAYRAGIERIAREVFRPHRMDPAVVEQVIRDLKG